MLITGAVSFRGRVEDAPRCGSPKRCRQGSGKGPGAVRRGKAVILIEVIPALGEYESLSNDVIGR
jgi:hypothetical protein